MRFMITSAPAPDAPRPAHDAAFDPGVMAAYMKFNEDMHRAGVLIASEGLHPAAQSARVGISGGKRAVIDGPFAESKELVGGFYLIEVKSRDEAIAWAMRCPTGMESADILTIHQMTSPSDIPPEMMKIIQEAAPTWSAAVMKSS